jgi:cyanophycin synthetase
MTIVSLKVLNGPNIWSVRRTQLIQMLLDLHELEFLPSSSIPGFYDRLVELMPSLYTHHCSEGREGGFFERVRVGTWMGHIVEHVALELQSLADMDAGFGRTRRIDKKGQYNVVFEYLDPVAGIYAAKAAVRIVDALVSREKYEIGCDLRQLTEIWNRNKFGPSTASIIHEAALRDIPWMKLDNDSYVQLGYGKNQKRIDASISSTTSAISVDIAADKHRTKTLLAKARIPVAQGEIISNDIQLCESANRIGFPLVIKPLNGNHGKGTTTNVQTIEEAKRALVRARQVSPQIICEQFIKGNDYRILVVNYKFVAAALRTPATVTGDGVHSIKELIDIANMDCRRGNNHDNILTYINIDDATMCMLGKRSLTPDSIVAAGEEVTLKPTANLSTGGTAEDVTDDVHPGNIALFERAARIIGLDICGIDVMAETLSERLQNNGGAILEINAAPGLRMHLYPSVGTPRNVATPIVDMLFPVAASARIPIIAVTGTNGKTTTTRLMAQIMKQAGYFTGYTTTDGVYAGDEMIDEGDCSGPLSARMLLQDPSIEVAVLECARGGVLRSGLGFDRCDVAIVTNVAADHLGLESINTLEDLAHVKCVIPETVHEHGTVVLNADDDLVYKMKHRVSAKVALFSMHSDNPRIFAHIGSGGLAAVVKNDHITFYHRHEEIPLIHVNDMPISFKGKATFNVSNAMGAALAAFAQGVSLEIIRQTLATFENSVHQTPGRLNVFEFNGYRVILDYAHNPHGLHALGKFINAFGSTKKIGIVTAVGDRRDEDVVAMGVESAKIFDEIVIRLDEDLRGRRPEELISLLLAGIRKVSETVPVHIFDNDNAAFEFGFMLMQTEYLLVMLVDKIGKAIGFVKEKMQSPVTAAEKDLISV